MTEHRDDKDNDLKAYLEGKDGVSATYDKLGKSEVPGHLDRLILNAAREDDVKKSGAGGSNSYFSQKYSIAASVLICVLIGAIYLTDQDVLQRDNTDMPASITRTESEAMPAAANDNSDIIANDAPQQQQRAFVQAPEAELADADIAIASTGNTANTESRDLGANMELSLPDIAESTVQVAEPSAETLSERVAQIAGSSEAEFSPEPISIDLDDLAGLVEESIASETAIERQQVATAVDEDTEEVVVTGSRIRTDGMESPNPVTVVTLEEIQLANPESLIDGLDDLPQFRASNTAGIEETSESDASDNMQLDAAGFDPITIYRDTPETWAQHIYTLTEDLAVLTQQNMAKTSGNGLDENAEVVVVTGSRVRLPEEGAGAAAGSSDDNAVDNREEFSEGDALRAQIELERREFSNTHPDIDLDALIEEILSNE